MAVIIIIINLVMGNEGWYKWNVQGINKNLYEILFWKREELRSIYAEWEWGLEELEKVDYKIFDILNNFITCVGDRIL
jgi:hypothetical protein